MWSQKFGIFRFRLLRINLFCYLHQNSFSHHPNIPQEPTINSEFCETSFGCVRPFPPFRDTVPKTIFLFLFEVFPYFTGQTIFIILVIFTFETFILQHLLYKKSHCLMSNSSYYSQYWSQWYSLIRPVCCLVQLFTLPSSTPPTPTSIHHTSALHSLRPESLPLQSESLPLQPESLPLQHCCLLLPAPPVPSVPCHGAIEPHLTYSTRRRIPNQ